MRHHRAIPDYRAYDEHLADTGTFVCMYLRHFLATTLLGAGVGLQSVAGRPGHAGGGLKDKPRG